VLGAILKVAVWGWRICLSSIEMIFKNFALTALWLVLRGKTATRVMCTPYTCGDLTGDIYTPYDTGIDEKAEYVYCLR
jgi:hypothetical protein